MTHYFTLNKGEPKLTLSIKEQLISEIQGVANLTVLIQLFEFWQHLNKPLSASPPSTIFALAGSLDNAEAEALRHTIQTEFQHLEGEW